MAEWLRAWHTLIMFEGGREFDPQPGQYSRISFSSQPGDRNTAAASAMSAADGGRPRQSRATVGNTSNQPKSPVAHNEATHSSNLASQSRFWGTVFCIYGSLEQMRMQVTVSDGVALMSQSQSQMF